MFLEMPYLDEVRALEDPDSGETPARTTESLILHRCDGSVLAPVDAVRECKIRVGFTVEGLGLRFLRGISETSSQHPEVVRTPVCSVIQFETICQVASVHRLHIAEIVSVMGASFSELRRFRIVFLMDLYEILEILISLVVVASHELLHGVHMPEMILGGRRKLLAALV